MTERSRFDVLRALFDEARGLSDAEQAAFVAERCGADAALRTELLALLEQHAADCDLDRSPVSGALTAMFPDDAVAADTIDRYELGGVLGEGGFGVVYEARQTEPVRRRVAVKVIKPGMDSRAVVTRFEGERQALAMMDHPGVARVFDGGVTRQGRPYFAMELVDGPPITRYCDEHRLRPQERIALVIRACEALQHAHTKGVIHRDLKPGNILVGAGDDGPQPKIIDFGIAKALGDPLSAATQLTQHGQLIGTPEYMSPEQVGGEDTDTRTDVYAIGVVLYELLTGASPFAAIAPEAGGFAEFQRIIRDVEPQRPSTRVSTLATGDAVDDIARKRATEVRTLTSMLRRDLDWIVMRCLEKDPDRRYATASALADDLRRFLRDEPVLAGPPSARYRAQKFIRRNRPLVFGASMLFVAMVIAVIGTSLGLARALHAEAATADAAAISAAINAFLNDDLLAAVDPARTADRDVTMREVLDAASERIEGRFPDQPAVEAELRTTIANTYWRLGDAATAEVHRRRAIVLLEQVYGRDAEETISANHSLSADLLEQGHVAEALAHTEAELEFLRGVRAPTDPATLRAVGTLGTIYLMSGRFGDAIPLLEETLRDKQATLGPRDPSTLTSTHNIAGLYLQLGRVDEALVQYRAAYEGRREVLGAGDPKTLSSAVAMSIALMRNDAMDEAQALLLTVHPQLEERLGPAHRLTLLALSHLATIARDTDRLEEAEERFATVLARRRESLGDEHAATIEAMALLGDVIARRGRHEEAMGLLEVAVEVGNETLPAGHWQQGLALVQAGRCARQLNDMERAEAWLVEAGCLLNASVGSEHRWTAEAVTELATLYRVLGRGAEAEALDAARAEDRLESVLCADRPEPAHDRDATP